MYDIDNGLPQRFQKVVKCHTVILSKIPATKAFQMAMYDYLNEPLQKPLFSNHNLLYNAQKTLSAASHLIS